MKSLRIIISASLAILFCLSCSHDEDNTPSLADRNVFIPADDDYSATAQIRRSFFEQTGCYLLFSDSLQGTEMLDVLRYSMLGHGESTTYYYNYILQPDSQQLAANLIRDHLVRRLGRAQPYAYMVVNSISHYRNGQLVSDRKLLGLRAYAISLSGGEAYNSPDDYFKSMVGDMVKARLKSMTEEELESFYKLSAQYYNEDEINFGLTTKKETDEEMWPFGFFRDTHSSYFKSFNDDLEDWLDAVLGNSREEFESVYGAAKMMMDKYDALWGIITDMGYVLN